MLRARENGTDSPRASSPISANLSRMAQRSTPAARLLDGIFRLADDPGINGHNWAFSWSHEQMVVVCEASGGAAAKQNLTVYEHGSTIQSIFGAVPCGREGWQTLGRSGANQFASRNR